MEFEAFIHGVLASTQPAAGDDASRTPHSSFPNPEFSPFRPVHAAKITFYATIAIAAAIASLTAIPAFAAESTSSLQNLLANKGFYSGEIDGIEGSSTKQAIIKAQQFYGLSTDGVAGERTLVALQAEKAESASALTIAANISVSDLQALLAKRGFYKGSVDGVLGSSTQAAIVEAQRFYGLNPDGIVGNKTVEALEADKNTPQVVASSFTADDVSNLQKLLTSRGFYSGPISGFIGDLTKEAILKAQKFYGLTEDGVPGKATLAALEADSEYKKSAKTEDVRSVQTLLSERGFYKGAVDGVLGEETKDAIRAAQKSYGLTVDGVAGAETVSALNGSKSRRVSTRSTAPDHATAKTATRTAAAPSKTVEKTTLAKPSSTTRTVAAKPSSATKTEVTKPEVTKTVATKPAPKPEKPAESAVTVKPSTTKATATTATKPSTAHPEVTKTAATKPAPATDKTALKPMIATKTAATKPSTPLAEVSKTVAEAKSAAQPTPAQTVATAKPAAQPTPAQTVATKPAPTAEVAEVTKTATTPTSEPAKTANASIQTANPKSSASKNVQVSELQGLLTTRGFFTGGSTGVLDNETKNAIVRAQSFYGLTPADGELSPALVDSLNRDPFIAKDN
jgi:peptidoglycan hydrolase-like protein with peptidoglycan-binding domain